MFLTSQVSKGVNDDTEDEVKNDDNDDKEEQEVVHDPSSKQRLLDGRVAVKNSIVIENSSYKYKRKTINYFLN